MARKEVSVSDTDFLEDVSDDFYERMHPHLGDENPLWTPLATALALSIKTAIRKAARRAEEGRTPCDGCSS